MNTTPEERARKTRLCECGHARKTNTDWRLESFRSSTDIVILHGIDLEMMDGEWCPVIPRLGPLLELGQANPDCKEFQWLCEDKKWTCIRV